MRRNNLSVLSQLHCPNGISPMGNSGCSPLGKPAATESRYPTSGTCWVFFCVSVIHRTLTWTTGSLTWAQMLMHATAHGGVRTPKESLHWKLTLRGKSPVAPGNRTFVSSVTVRCSTNELHPQPKCVIYSQAQSKASWSRWWAKSTQTRVASPVLLSSFGLHSHNVYEQRIKLKPDNP